MRPPGCSASPWPALSWARRPAPGSPGPLADRYGRIVVMKMAAAMFFVSSIGYGPRLGHRGLERIPCLGRHCHRRRQRDCAGLYRRSVACLLSRTSRLASATGDRRRHLCRTAVRLCAGPRGRRRRKAIVVRIAGLALDVHCCDCSFRCLCLSRQHDPGIAALSRSQETTGRGGRVLRGFVGNRPPVEQKDPRDRAERRRPNESAASAIWPGPPSAFSRSYGPASCCRHSSNSSASM